MELVKMNFLNSKTGPFLYMQLEKAGLMRYFFLNSDTEKTKNTSRRKHDIN